MRIIDPVRMSQLSGKWVVTTTEDINDYQTFDTYEQAIACWVDYLKQKYQVQTV